MVNVNDLFCRGGCDMCLLKECHVGVHRQRNRSAVPRFTKRVG